ncbi:hypothetical protein D3C78_826730 [compost metagenome]
MPFLRVVVDWLARLCIDAKEEFVGHVRGHLGVVVAHTWQEGPLVPADLILGKQAVGVDGRVREIADQFLAITRAVSADSGAGAADIQAGAATTARTGDFLMLEGGAIGQQVLGLANAEGFVQLGIKQPLTILVGGLAITEHLAAPGNIELFGALVGLADLVVQAPFHVVGKQSAEGEFVVHAEAFAGDGVIAGPVTVRVHGTKARNERAAHRAQLIQVAVVLVMLVGEGQARVVGIVPASLGQNVGGANVFRVGFGTLKAGATVAAIGLSLMAVALAQVQQAVEVAMAPGNGGRIQPAFVCRAVAGLQARTNVFTGLDDVIRVEGEVADCAADGVAAVQHRRWATQNFDALDDLGIDVVALGLSIRAEEEAVGDRHTVDLGQHTLTVDPTNVVAVKATALTGAADRNTGLVTHQFLDVVDVLAVELLTGLYRYGTRHLADVLGTTGSADGDLLQGDGAGVVALQHHVTCTEGAVFQAGASKQAL